MEKKSWKFFKETESNVIIETTVSVRFKATYPMGKNTCSKWKERYSSLVLKTLGLYSLIVINDVKRATRKILCSWPNKLKAGLFYFLFQQKETLKKLWHALILPKSSFRSRHIQSFVLFSSTLFFLAAITRFIGKAV